MGLYLKNSSYKEKVLEDAKREVSRRHTVIDAFFLLIKDVEKEDLSNLCDLMKEYLQNVDLTVDDCYQLTQGNNVQKLLLTTELKWNIYHIAWGCLKDNLPLGSKTIQNGAINTSDWIGHSMWEGRLCAEFAKIMGLDVYKAINYGLLHDFGRKFTHGLEHITKGYEALSDLGWNEEALGCLTHSFLGGDRCAWNGTSVPGFFVDDNGIAHFEEGCEKDDITIFLENYVYSEYDNILNIADLMANANGIVSPATRIADIATRKKIDPKNRGYFLAELTNNLVKMSRKMGSHVPEEFQEKVYARKGVSLEEITEKFQRASEYFFIEYLKRI